MGEDSIMKYILLKENKLTKLIASQKSRTELNQTLQPLDFDFDSILEVPENFETRIGADINEYDASLKYKSEEQRIIEGYKEVPKGMKIEEGKLIQKTILDQITDKEIILNEHEYYDSEKKEICFKERELTEEEKKEQAIQDELRLMAIERLEKKGKI